MSMSTIMEQQRTRQTYKDQRVPESRMTVREICEVCFYASSDVASAGLSRGVFARNLEKEAKKFILCAYDRDKAGQHLCGRKFKTIDALRFTRRTEEMFKFPDMFSGFNMHLSHVVGAMGVLWYILLKGRGDVSLTMSRLEMETFVKSLDLKLLGKTRFTRTNGVFSEFLSLDVQRRARALADEYDLAELQFPDETPICAYTRWRKSERQLVKDQKFVLYGLNCFNMCLLENVFSFIVW